MLPYIAQPRIALGPVTIYAFGILVAIAVLVGTEVAHRRAARIGLPAGAIDRMLTWVVVGGFLGGHVLDLLLYEPRTLLTDPWRLLRLWDGLGSFGGFVGAVAGAALYIWRRQPAHPWRHVDAIAYAFPFGWIFGRIGCALAFDHVGRATSFVLGQRYVDGVVRHNLGLEEAVYTIGIAALFAVLGRRRRPPAFFTGLLALVYAPVRFALDALRVGDARYLGLTPAQYGSVLLAVVGVVLLVAIRSRDENDRGTLVPA